MQNEISLSPTQSLPITDHAEAPRSPFEEFAASALHYGVEEPVNGAVQLANKIPVLNLHIPELQLLEKPLQPAKFNSCDYWMQQAGATVGMIPGFLLTSLAVDTGLRPAQELLAGGAAAANGAEFTIARSAVAGGLYSGVLKPTGENGDSSSFWSERAVNALSGAIGFGAMAGASSAAMNPEINTLVKELPQNSVRRFLLNSGASAAGAMFGGSVGLEASSLLRTGHAASGTDLYQNALSMGLMGAGLGILNAPGTREGEPSAARPSENEVASAVEKVETHQTETQAAVSLKDLLSQGDIQDVKTFETPDSHKEIIEGKIKRDSDTANDVPVIIRKTSADPWTRVKFEKGEKAGSLNALMGERYKDDVPVVAQRQLTIDGKPESVTVEQNSGESLVAFMSRLADVKYGVSEPEMVVPQIAEDPILRGNLETALALRMWRGTLDFNPWNFTVRRYTDPVSHEPSFAVSNIDEKTAFSPTQKLSWGAESIQQPMKDLRDLFADKPLSPALKADFERFVQNYDSSDGRQSIKQLGFSDEETGALIDRARGLATNGFPRAYWITDPEIADYFPEKEIAHDYFRRVDPVLDAELKARQADD